MPYVTGQTLNRQVGSTGNWTDLVMLGQSYGSIEGTDGGKMGTTLDHGGVRSQCLLFAQLREQARMYVYVYVKQDFDDWEGEG